jgi:hypothetical protein
MTAGRESLLVNVSLPLWNSRCSERATQALQQRDARRCGSNDRHYYQHGENDSPTRSRSVQTVRDSVICDVLFSVSCTYEIVQKSQLSRCRQAIMRTPAHNTLTHLFFHTQSLYIKVP